MSIADGIALVGADLKDDQGSDSGTAYFYEFVDVTAPTVLITTTASNPVQSAFSTEFSFSERVKEFELSDILVSNAVISNLTTTDSIKFSATVHPIEDGEIIISLEEDATYDQGNNGSLAATPLTVDYQGLLYVYESQILEATSRVSKDMFGHSVDIYQNYAIVSAHHKTATVNGKQLKEAGAAYLFERDNNGKWHFRQELISSDLYSYDNFGSSVSITDGYAIVGAKGNGGDVNSGSYMRAGSAYIFARDSTGHWQETQKLVASDRIFKDIFGFAVAIDGNYAIVGDFLKDDIDRQYSNTGAAYVFERNQSGEWIEVQKLEMTDPYPSNLFGKAVSISGDYAMVGAPGNAEAVLVYHRDHEGTWNEVQKLAASQGHAGALFGDAISVFNDRAVIGAPVEAYNLNGDNHAWGVGAGYVFKRDASGLWEEEQRIVASSKQTGRSFGHSVSLSEKRIAVSDGGINPYIFEYNASVWTETARLAVSYISDPQRPNGVGISNDNIITGFPSADAGGVWNSGIAAIYGLNSLQTVAKHNVTIDQPTANRANEKRLSFTVDDALPNSIYQYHITGRWNNYVVSGSGTATTSAYQVDSIDVSGLHDGTLTLSVNFFNQDSSFVASRLNYFAKDTSRPLVTIMADSLPQSILLTFNEAVYDFETSDIQITNGTVESLSTTNNRSFYATISILDTGTVTIWVPEGAARTAKGKESLASRQFSFAYYLDYPSIVPNQQFFVDENAELGTEIGSIKLAKLISTDSLIHWQIVAGNQDSTFAIDNYTGKLSVANRGIDYESVPKYELIISATNNGRDFVTELVFVKVMDLDEDYLIPVLKHTVVDSTNKIALLSINFTEVVSGFTVADFNVENALIANLTTKDNINFNAKITSVLSDTVTIIIPKESVVDLYGNANVTSKKHMIVWNSIKEDERLDTDTVFTLTVKIAVADSLAKTFGPLRVVIYQKVDDHFLTVSTLETAEDEVALTKLSSGEYTVGVYASSAKFHPTYLGDKLLLAQASTIILHQDTTQQIIVSEQVFHLPKGDAIISGTLVKGSEISNGRTTVHHIGMTGEVLPNVPLYLLDPQTKDVLAYVTTDAQGQFLFSNLSVGKYLLMADYRGITNDEVKNLINVVNATETLNVTVVTGNTIQIIEVDSKEQVTAIDNKVESIIQYYPNPVVDKISINLLTGWIGGAIRLQDAAGRILTEKQISADVMQLDLKSYEGGIYLVTLYKGKQVRTFKICKP